MGAPPLPEKASKSGGIRKCNDGADFGYRFTTDQPFRHKPRSRGSNFSNERYVECECDESQINLFPLSLTNWICSRTCLSLRVSSNSPKTWNLHRPILWSVTATRSARHRPRPSTALRISNCARDALATPPGLLAATVCEILTFVTTKLLTRRKGCELA